MNIRATLNANPDGSRSTAFPCLDTSGQTDCAPPTINTLSCNDSAAPSLANLITTNAYSADVRQYFSGLAAATATLSVVPVSGTDATANGWAISSAGAGNNLTNAGSNAGSGVLKIRGTTGGNSVDCSNRNWSYAAAGGSDTTAPTIPTGLVMTPGSGTCAFTHDASQDPYVGAAGSGVDQYDYRCGTTVVHTTTGASHGLSQQLTLTNIGGSTPTPTAVQTGVSWAVSAGGVGFHGTNDGEGFNSTSIANDFTATVKVTSFTPTVDQFSNAGIMVRETLSSGSKFFTCYQQQSDGSVQCKSRVTTGGSATNLATIAGVGGTVWIQVRATRSTNVWSGWYSTDGNVWQPIVNNGYTLAMASTVNVGQVISSRVDGTPVSATLDQWSLNNVAQPTYAYTTASVCSGSVRARDVAGNNSAYGAAVSCTPGAPPSALVKWHPGHYIKAGESEGLATNSGAILKINDDSHIVGIDKTAYMADVESSQGVYNWSAMTSLVSYLAGQHKMLIFQLMDRKFGTSSSAGIVPSYLTSQLYKTTSGYGLAIWRQAAMDRLIATVQSFCATFDTDPHVEMIRLPSETSPAVPSPLGSDSSDYSAAALTTQLSRLWVAGAAACPHTLLTASINYPVAQASQLVSAQMSAKIGFGGPDAISTSGLTAFGTAVGPTKYSNYMIASSDALGGKHDNGPATNIITFCQGSSVKCSHLSWITYAAATGDTWANVLSAIDSNPNLYATCPSVYPGTGKCDTTAP